MFGDEIMLRGEAAYQSVKGTFPGNRGYLVGSSLAGKPYPPHGIAVVWTGNTWKPEGITPLDSLDDLQTYAGVEGTVASVNGVQYTYGAGGWVEAGGGIEPLNRLDYSKILGRVVAQNADQEVNLIGDSTTRGLASGVTPYVSLASYLKKYLPSYINPVIGWVVLRIADVDGAISVGTGWNTAVAGTGVGFGGNSGIAGASPAGSIVYTPEDVCNGFDVIVFTNPGYGTVSIQGTGGVTVNQSTASAIGLLKISCSCATAQAGNTLTITGASGTCGVMAVRAKNSTKKQTYINSLGVGSSRMEAWGLTDATTYKSKAALAYTAPAISIIMLGINDAANSVSTSVFTSSLDTLIGTNIPAGGTFILCPPHPSSPIDQSGATIANEMLYKQIIKAKADAIGCTFVDLWPIVGGAWNASDYADTLHLRPFKNAEVAQAYARTLLM